MEGTPRRPLRRIITMLRPHAAGEAPAFASGAILGLATVVLHVLRPWPLKWIVDGLGGSPVADPLWLVVAFVALAAAGSAAAYGQAMVLNGLGNRILYRFREQLFRHILRQPMAFHETREVGELMTRIVYDTTRLRRGLNGMLVRIVQTVALFAASMAALLWIDPRLAGVLLAGGGVALLMMQRRGQRIASVAKKQRAKEGLLAALVGSELMAVRELQAFGFGGSAVAARFAARNSRSMRQELKLQRLSLGLSMRVDIAVAASIAVAMWLGATGVRVGELTAGDLVLFLSYALALRAPFADFAVATARIGRTFACAERLDRIMRRGVAVADRPDAVDPAGVQGALRFEKVALLMPKRRRTDRKWALEKVVCEVPVGRRIAIVGGNGAGKSTMLSLMLRLADPTRGRILLDDRDLHDYALEPLRRRMSVVFQDSVLTGVSVHDNIALGDQGASVEAVRRAAEQAGVARFIERLPQGYDTVVRHGGDLFSGGERQRIALARAMLRDGRIWLLDEPTTGLDHESARQMTDRLFEVTTGRTVLWVTHDPDLLPRMDLVLELGAGRVLFVGTPSAYADRGTSGTAPAITTLLEH
ncbi:MAG: ABC transporter ATP-binding protein/permease [Gemmatimonadetes bacterium]|nr:ABC transporter ATP-binding protein/permease [Gemmatimonadota bacterium]